MSIEVSNISKKYGAQLALDDVTFSVGTGEIVGFLGPNGAGKSTLMKILTTYIASDHGKAEVAGFDVAENPHDVRRSVGYLPEHNPLYLDLYVREYLEFSAGVHGLPVSRVTEVISLTGLTPEQHKKIGQLSKGYRQRVGLATALLHNPQVLILDEPTTGLDPNQLVEIRRVIKNAGKDKTVFLSTHILQEVEAICDRVIIIDKGKIVADKKLDNLMRETEEVTQQVLEIEFDGTVAKEKLESIPALTAAENTGGNRWELTFTTGDDMRAAVFDFASAHGLKMLHIAQKARNLETVFRDLTKNQS
jgi:ABC-2 type transport system ATP-binding protein